MPSCLENLTILNRCNQSHFRPGRSGQPVAIVYQSVGFTLQVYDSLLATPLPVNYQTAYPRSVHFLIDEVGVIVQYVETNNRAYGLYQYFEPTWPGLTVNMTDPNDPFLFIGFTGSGSLTDDQLSSAVSLSCCLALQFNISVNTNQLIVGRDLDSRRSLLPSLPVNLTGLTSGCVTNGGVANLPNIVDLTGRVETLEACCATNSTAILGLNTRLTAEEIKTAQLLIRVTSLEAWRTIAQPAINGLVGTIGSLTTGIQALQALVAKQQICIDLVCPDLNGEAVIHYTLLLESQAQVTPPNVPMWLNPPTRVSDENPAAVITGPLWTAVLDNNCIWRIAVVLRFRFEEWCAGKRAQLFIVACGNQTLIGEKLVTANGRQLVQIEVTNFLLTVPPTCNDVHFLVLHDDIITPTKTVDYLDVTMRCS